MGIRQATPEEYKKHSRLQIVGSPHKKKKEELFLTAEEVADLLKVNIMTIYRYIKAGKLEALKLGKNFRIENKEFERFLSSLKMNNDNQKK